MWYDQNHRTTQLQVIMFGRSHVIALYMNIHTLIAVLMLCSCAMAAQVRIPHQQREGEKHRNDYERYFESLHVVPPGMNWKVVNEEVRSMRAQRTAKRSEGVQTDTIGVHGTWRELGSSNQAGRVVAAEYDKATKRVWAAGAGGTVWEGNINGTSWKCLTDAKRIEDPVFLKHIVTPNNGERLIALSSGARCYYRNNDAPVWQQANGLTEMQRWGAFSDAVCITRDDGNIEIIAIGYEWDYGPAWKSRNVVYQSSDTGTTFSRIKWFDGQRSIYATNNECFVLHGDTISAVNADGTLSAVHTSGGPWTAPGVRSVLMAGVGKDYVAMGLVKGNSTTFYLSEDGALDTWDSTSTLNTTPFNARSFEIEKQSYTWLFGGVEVFVSNDAGFSFEKKNRWGEYYAEPATKLHADIPNITSWGNGGNNDPLFIATDGGLYVSHDHGVTVNNLSLKGLNISQYYSSYTSRDNVDVVTAGAQDQGYQRSRIDSGGIRAFEQTISGDYSSLVSGDGGHTIYCVYPGFVMYVPDAEDNWGPSMMDFPHKGHMWLPPLTTSASNPNQVWLGGGTMSKGAKVYTYTHTSQGWEFDSLATDFGQGMADVNVTALTLAPFNDNIGYVVASQGVVWRTTDHGNTWDKFARPDKLNGHYFSGNALTTFPRDAYRVLIGGSGYSGPAVYLSNDGAETWTPLDGLPPCLVLSLAVSADERYIAAATDVGAFLYDTLTNVWTDITAQGAPDQTYWHVDYVPPLNIFRFSTYGRGIFDYTINNATSVAPGPNYIANTITARGVVSNVNQSLLQIHCQQETVATISWYSLDGRFVHEQATQLNNGLNSIVKPSAALGPSTAVVKTLRGHIVSAVVP